MSVMELYTLQSSHSRPPTSPRSEQLDRRRIRPPSLGPPHSHGPPSGGRQASQLHAARATTDHDRRHPGLNTAPSHPQTTAQAHRPILRRLLEEHQASQLPRGPEEGEIEEGEEGAAGGEQGARASAGAQPMAVDGACTCAVW